MKMYYKNDSIPTSSYTLPGSNTPKSYRSASITMRITLDFLGRHILEETFTSFKICVTFSSLVQKFCNHDLLISVLCL